MKYDRTVIAYHGCDADIAERLLRGESFKKSQNDYDWLGEGIYFWEYGADRAMRFARDQMMRGKVQTPAVVGALVQLGRCFDLMDTRFTDELPIAFELFKKVHLQSAKSLPENRGRTPDKLLRHRDCAVLNFYCVVGVFRPTIMSWAAARTPAPRSIPKHLGSTRRRVSDDGHSPRWRSLPRRSCFSSWFAPGSTPRMDS